MQKKLIALAIAAAFSTPVLAADASVYGIIDGGIASISSDGHESDMRAVSGGLSASRIGVNASEDLDNGMKVSINVEYGMDTQKDTAATGPFTTRQEMLALSGDFGKLSTGYLHTVAFFFNLKYDPTYGSLISPLQAINSGAGSFLGTAARMTQTIAYATPKMGPFSAEVNYSTGNADGANSGLASNNNTVSNKTTIMLLSGTYADGPLSVSAVYGKDSSDFT
ncbi:MAG: porin, partial [Sideroxydans sp.]